MRPFLRVVAAAFALAGLFVAGSESLSATVMVAADLGELTRDAQAIARGRVVAVEGRWAEGRRTIETVVTLETEDYLKGSLGETTQFKVPGGTFGRYTNIIVGAPQFAVGQHVIVFLGARGPMVPFVVGMSQGVFRVVDAGDGRTLVLPPPVLPGTIGPSVRGATTRAPASLAAFEREVRSLVGAAQ